MQANSIQEKELFATEAHIHILTNMFERSIIVFTQRPPWIEAIYYKPGYVPQKIVPRQQVPTLLKTESPLCLTLDYPPTHFTAVVPVRPSADRAAKGKKVEMESLLSDNDSD